MTRKIHTIIRGRDTTDGAGVHLRRVFANGEIPLFDPFLMLDFFDSENPSDYTNGFPWHPHRGIETITFLFEGVIEHGDSLGNAGVIESGDCQWMTAGSGIIHQEMPKASPRMLGFQLWANLPAKDKMVDPAYHEIKADDVVQVEDSLSTVRIIAGSYSGTKGLSLRTDLEANMLDVLIKPDCTWELPTDPEHKVFALLVRGSASFAPGQSEESRPGGAILYESGDRIEITAAAEGARVLVVSGKPIGEPVAWGGPIVMNTQEELRLAFKEFREGTFIKHGNGHV